MNGGRSAPGRTAILAAVMLGSILGPIDASIVNVILPTITGAFGANLAVAQGVPLAYLVAIGGLSLVFGRLGALVGYRRVFLAGILFFVAASCLCAAAPGIGWLVAFRAVQGIAAAMTSSVPLAILTRSFPAALFGLGTGAFQSPNSSAAMGSAPREHLGVVSSVLATMRTLGMTLGVAAAGAILYAVVPAAALEMSALAPERLEPFRSGLGRAYAAGAIFAALSGLLSLLRGRSLIRRSAA